MDEIVRVDLYTVVTTFAVLLTSSSVGVASNTGFLLATVWRLSSDSPRPRRRILVVLGALHLVACLLHGPLQFAVATNNYVHRRLPSPLCYASVVVFHFLLAATLSCVLLLAGCHHLERRISLLSTTPSRVTAIGRALTGLHLVAPWIVGAVVGVVAAADAPNSVDLFVCQTAVVSDRRPSQGGPGGADCRARSVLSVVYVVVLAVSARCLARAYFQCKMEMVRLAEGGGCDGGEPQGLLMTEVDNDEATTTRRRRDVSGPPPPGSSSAADVVVSTRDGDATQTAAPQKDGVSTLETAGGGQLSPVSV